MSLLDVMASRLKMPVCPDGCHDCCCAVMLLPEEADRIGKPGAEHTAWKPNGECEFVGDDGRCTQYENRPFQCRAFGCPSDGLMHCRKMHKLGIKAPMEYREFKKLEELYFTLLCADGRPPADDFLRACAKHDIEKGLRSPQDMDIEEVIRVCNEARQSQTREAQKNEN